MKTGKQLNQPGALCLKSLEQWSPRSPTRQIQTQPIAAVTVCQSTTTSFTIQVAAPSATLQWQVQSAGIGPFTNISNDVNYGGATTTSLTISSIPYTFNGNVYRCIVNYAGNIETSTVATMTVNRATIINIQPSNTTVCLNASATFSLTATGTTLTYQWYSSTGTINGATSSTLQITTATNTYNYTCVVNGVCGVVTSTIATLAIYSSSVSISVQPSSTSVCLNASTILTLGSR